MGCRKVIALVLAGTSSALLLFPPSHLTNIILPAARAASKAGNSNSAPPAVCDLELRLFFKNYPDDSLPVRVERIEKQVFGQAIEGDLDERLSRLSEFLARQLQEEKQKEELSQRRKAQEEAAKAAASARQSTEPARPRQPAADDSDIERARIAIQAAREQEITGLLAEGVELWRNKRGQQALERFEQVLRLDPHNAEAHFSTGIIEESAGNYVEALSSYRQALSSDPANREYKDAVAVVEKKASAKQNKSGLRADLKILAENALAAFKRGEYNSALDLYMQLDAKAPDQSLVKYNMGTLYLLMKDQTTALSYYKQAHKLAPDDPRYKKAYEDLSGTINKAQKEQAREEKQEESELKQAQAAARSKKTSARANGMPAMRAAGAGNGAASSPFGMPTPGRSSFGVNPAMFAHGVPQPRQQAPGGVISSAAPPSQQDIMSSFGLIGRAGGQGVTVTSVGIASRAAAAGLVPGDEIVAVDGNQVSKPEDINSILGQKRGGQVQMMIMRNGNLAVVNL